MEIFCLYEPHREGEIQEMLLFVQVQQELLNIS